VFDGLRQTQDGSPDHDVVVTGEDQTAQDVLAMQAELLLSEGIDPTWVPSTAAELP
jgi:hypothetical protein